MTQISIRRVLFACALVPLMAAPPTWSASLTPPMPLPPEFLPPVPAWKGRSETVIAKPDHPWITPAEVTGFALSPSYADTRADVVHQPHGATWRHPSLPA